MGRWADWLGVPRLTLFATLGGVIARGGDHREALAARPTRDRSRRRDARPRSGRSRVFGSRRPTCTRMRSRVFALWPPMAFWSVWRRTSPRALRRCFTDWTCRWPSWPPRNDGASPKPDPAFFARICDELRLPAGQIVYVGDRLDNDIEPAAAAGMRPVFIRRGPWAMLQSASRDPTSAGAVATIDSLAELPDLVKRLGAREG